MLREVEREIAKLAAIHATERSKPRPDETLLKRLETRTASYEKRARVHRDRHTFFAFALPKLDRLEAEARRRGLGELSPAAVRRIWLDGFEDFGPDRRGSADDLM